MIPTLRSFPLVASLVLAAAPATGLAAQELYRVRVETPWAEAYAAQLEEEGFDVVHGSARDGAIELVVTPDSLVALDRRGLTPEVLEVGRPLARILAEREGRDGSSGEDAVIPAGYRTLPQVIQHMQQVAATYPSIAQFVDLNATYGLPTTTNGNRLFALKISDNVTQDEDEPAVFIHTGAHAREIVPVVVALDVIDRLTQGYGSNPFIDPMVDGNEIWILPVANPDGYEYVFNVNNLWRKNLAPYPGGVGVDLNRNYDFDWGGSCSGSTNVVDDTYKGPFPESEIETQVVVALSRDKSFAKVADFHSYGSRVQYEYACGQHPLAGLLRNQAIEIANYIGWPGTHGAPAANGLHFEWQLAEFSAYAFQVQTLGCCTFQPTYEVAQAEAAQVWPAARFMFRRFIDVSGHVTDACTGQPVVANITYEGLPFLLGEQNRSEPDFGRYHAWLPEGEQTLNFTAPGYLPQAHTVTVLPTSGVALEVQLLPVVGSASAVTRNGSGANVGCYSTVSPPVLGGTWIAEVNHVFHPGASATSILVYSKAGGGVFGPGGEVLVDLGSKRVFQSTKASSGTSDFHFNNIPNDPCLGGLFAASQAVILGGGWELCNAEDLTSGY